MTVSRKLSLPLRGAALALCSVAVVALATPASARPRHGASHHHHVHHSKHHAKKHYGHRHRHHARRGRYAAAAAADTSASQGFGGFGGFGGSNVVAEARRYIGSGNPTGRASLWCARFMNMVLERSGHKGTGSDMARSFASYGHRISGPQVGAIAVMSRGRRGGHVGVVSGIDAKGNPIVISGNHGHRVAEATYSRGRIYAYVMPSS
ncbi:TIGR02594 family protein [Afipia clevelandensis]|uniref:TIGR02594 family protein n=1 Tax=Afipia clevelandensis ATCC 49720 TaxID=883079 RepID=K8NW80_9BRAD|nr:TIGR02594 family protein [Afipia clevelandensis]EKS32729.1 TIGR02594 family protein [Afipia clevelandensis ATCC 49720]